MKQGLRLLRVGVIVSMLLAVALVGEAWGQNPSESDPTLPAEYEGPPPEMHPDRWPGATEEPKKTPVVSESVEKDVLEFLQKHMKYYYDRLIQLKKKDENAYRRALEYLEEKVKQLRAMPEEVRDARIRNANVQVDILRTAKGYHEAKTDDERKALKEKLQKFLSEKFDIEQKVGEYRLKQLGEKLNQSKKKLDERAKDREKILTEELRCWLQPPAEAAAQTQPASQPAKSEPAPAGETKPAEPEPTKAPVTAPATQPAEPTSAPTTTPATQPS